MICDNETGMAGCWIMALCFVIPKGGSLVFTQQHQSMQYLTQLMIFLSLLCVLWLVYFICPGCAIWCSTDLGPCGPARFTSDRLPNTSPSRSIYTIAITRSNYFVLTHHGKPTTKVSILHIVFPSLATNLSRATASGKAAPSNKPPHEHPKTAPTPPRPLPPSNRKQTSLKLSQPSNQATSGRNAPPKAASPAMDEQPQKALRQRPQSQLSMPPK